MPLPLQGKTTVLTGAAGLLGQHFCRAVLDAGGRLVATDLDKPRSRSKLVALQEEHGSDRVLVVPMDITDKGSVDAAVDAATKAFGTVHALVNNAYPHNARYGRRFEDVDMPDFMENVGMHTGGYFLCAQRWIRLFKAQGHGNIINLASIYGVVAPRFSIYEGTTMTMPVEYAVIKAGILHLTRYIASYHRHQGIRCNSISPGGVRDGQPESFQEKYRALATNKGMVDPQDICGALVFLLSDASAFINGQNLVVDDGWTL